jgi:ATP-binding cassette subfamily F protein uup
MGLEIAGRRILDKVDLVLSPGIKLGLMGPNGAGKSTLLKLLAEKVPPTSGRIVAAESIRLVYFDQNRDQLVMSATLKETLAPHGDSVMFQDRLVHITSYVKQFHFSPEHLQVPIGELSGGEQARALIAKLMLTPADVLLLDEPTNDLDIETLETLAQSIEGFRGAVVIVSHDRYLIDQVCNSIAAIKPDGQLGFYADLEQWEEAVKADAPKKGKTQVRGVPEDPGAKKPKTSSKLSYMEQREFDGMEAAIHKAEEELARAQQVLEDPKTTTATDKLLAASKGCDDAQNKLQKLYDRWQELEAKLEEMRKN